MDSPAIRVATLNQLICTLLAIVFELARRLRIEIPSGPLPHFDIESPRDRGAPSTGSFEFLHPEPPPRAAQTLLDPPRCEFHCRWCEEACSRIAGQHKYHSCWEHRHRRYVDHGK